MQKSRIYPVYLDGAAGWLHPAQGARAVVVVGAFGYEDLCSRRTLTLLADDLASAGLPTLRIDPREMGDSQDLPASADRVESWCEDVAAAVAFMRARPGIREIVLIGFRLGALLATWAAARAAAVDHLVLLAPPVSGKGHGRELGIVARLLDPTGEQAAAITDGISVGGFHMSSATLAGMAKLDFDRLAGWPGARVTLVGDVESAGFTKLAGRWPERAPRPTIMAFKGYSEMMCDPTASEPALETIADIVSVLSLDQPLMAADIDQTAEPRLPMAMLTGNGWIEEPIVLADGLIGILCRPATIPASDAVIWLNSGRNYHIGWARQTVDLSRQMAVSGTASLRVDFAGIGDSPARAETPALPIYHGDGQIDVAIWINEMARRGFEDVSIVGSCSGGYQAFHAAMTDRRIKRLVLVNVLCFVWGPSYLADFSNWMRARPDAFATETRVADAIDPDALDGRIQAMVQDLRLVARAMKAKLKRLLTAFRAPAHGPVEQAFRDFSERGVSTLIVLSDGDKAVVELERHTGLAAKAIADLPGIDIVTLPNADHSLSSAAARQTFGDLLAAHLASSHGGEQVRQSVAL